MSPDVFLSYSREDQATARRFAAALEREGLSVWWDQTLRSGDAYDEITERALRDARAVVVLWSKTSVASRWVRAEATIADRARKLVPAMIEECDRPVMFELTQTADLSHWTGDPGDPAWRAYVEDLRQRMGRDLPVASTVVPPSRPPRRRPMGLAAGLLVVFGVVAATTYLQQHRSAIRTDASVPAATSAPPAVPQPAPIRIMVRPFRTDASAEDQGIIGGHLASELAHLLGQVRGLQPMGEATSGAFEGQDPRDIGTQLDVRYVVDGKVLRDGERIRVFAELVDTSTGVQRWSDSYESKFRDAFSLYEEIAREVAPQIGVVLDAGNLPRALGGTNDPEAYEKYLRALSLPPGPEERRVTREKLLREAVQLDPRFASAWLELLTSVSVGIGTSPSTAAYLGEREVLLDRLQSLPFEGYQQPRIRAEVYMYQHRWSEALAAARSAAAAAPSPELGASILWPVLLRVGWFEEAITNMHTVLQTDPRSGRAARLLFSTLRMLGRDEEARAISERFDVPPVPLIYGTLSPEFVELIESGVATEPADIAKMKRLLSGEDGGVLAQGFGIAPAVLAEAGAAPAALRDYFASRKVINERDLMMVSGFARFYGDADLAFSAFRRAAMETGVSSIATWISPAMRRDPRFRELLREMKLLDFWRAEGRLGDLCRQLPGGKDFVCE